MKQSYFQTPRTTEECTFHSWADPIQVGQPNQNTGIDPDLLVTGISIACVIFAIVYAIVV